MSKPTVYIVLYSLYQHVYKLSLSIKEGLEANGVNVQIFQVAETLTDDILQKMQAPAKPDLPIMTVDRLAEPDGILFGLPTRFGMFPSQIKTLLDASGALWAKGALVGKFAGTFFATASQHGGQETTALTAVSYFAHQGMMYVPFGFADPALSNNDEVIGGSAYGAGTITNGDGSRQPSTLELQIAKHQGESFAKILTTYVKGKNATRISALVDPGVSATSVEAKNASIVRSDGSLTNSSTANRRSVTDTTSGSLTSVHDKKTGGAVAAGGAALTAATLAAKGKVLGHSNEGTKISTSEGFNSTDHAAQKLDLKNGYNVNHINNGPDYTDNKIKTGTDYVNNQAVTGTSYATGESKKGTDYAHGQANTATGAVNSQVTNGTNTVTTQVKDATGYAVSPLDSTAATIGDKISDLTDHTRAPAAASSVPQTANYATNTLSGTANDIANRTSVPIVTGPTNNQATTKAAVATAAAATVANDPTGSANKKAATTAGLNRPKEEKQKKKSKWFCCM